ncbi:unnamed protein product [Aureobasidium vineae]|uniref:Uncharacterized protein n=1 Tax=Aureobasidium vineae TaxID=2773715 RepID=A0A9N8J9F4_9PEZI|nr:unnamed protein product [Aureobasidium vineae]
MGRLSHESSSSRSSIDTTLNGEGLPLYSDISVASPSDLTAPGEKATPDEVRDFLVQLLIKNRGLHPDHARRVAAKWTLGTGRELTTYPPLLYAEIFGLEDAWMVYKEAKLFIRTEKNKDTPNGSCKSCFSSQSVLDYTDVLSTQPGIAVGVCLVIFGVALTTALLTDFDNWPFVKVVAVIASGLSGMISFVAVMCAIFDKTTEETKIENELTAGLVKKSKD